MPSILITGASAGIGAAIARAAAAQGWDVGVNYRSDRAGAEAVAADVAAAGRRAVPLQGDVAEEAEIVAMFDAHAAALGAPGAVIGNAGIVPPRGRPLAEATAAEMETVIRVNVMGALLTAREAVRRMSVARGGAGGVLVNISSVAARRGGPGEYVDYAASKGAMDAMTVGLAAEHAQDGIRVLGLRPGPIETAIHAKGGQPDRLSKIGAAIPMGRSGTPEEVAAVAMFLVSGAASYMTGTILDVSGGR